MQNVFAQEHGKVFPITTTATSYSTENNSYDVASTSSGVRLVFTAPSDGVFKLTIDVSSSDYYLDECDDAFASCGRIGNIYSTIWTTTISAHTGDSHYYKMTDYTGKSPSQTFEISYEKLVTYSVKIHGRDTSVLSGNSISINAARLTGPKEVFVKWKINSGTGSFSNASSSSTYFTPTSDAEIDIETKAVSLYALTDKYKSYVYNTNGYEKTSSYYAVRTYFAATDPSYYVLFVQSVHDNDILLFNSDSSYSSYSTKRCYSGVCRYTFYSAAGAKNYFELYPYYSSYSSDTVSVKVEKTVKINSETTGLG